MFIAKSSGGNLEWAFVILNVLIKLFWQNKVEGFGIIRIV
jgi:hypothetical protein